MKTKMSQIASEGVLTTRQASGISNLAVSPAGSGIGSAFYATAVSDITNTARVFLSIDNTSANLITDAVGTGTALPLTIVVGGAERMRITTAGVISLFGTGNFTILRSATPGLDQLTIANMSGSSSGATQGYLNLNATEADILFWNYNFTTGQSWDTSRSWGRAVFSAAYSNGCISFEFGAAGATSLTSRCIFPATGVNVLQANGTVQATSYIVPAANQGYTFIDSNTRVLVDSGRNVYFDTYAATFFWRNSAASFTEYGHLNAGGMSINGSYYFFASNSGVYLYWDGANIHTSHPIINNGSNYYFANSGSIWVAWHGSGYIWTSHSILIGGTGIYFQSNAAIYWNFTGTYMQTATYTNISGQNFRVGAGIASAQDRQDYQGISLPQAANAGGTGLGWAWSTYSSVDHAAALGLEIQDVEDPLTKVRGIKPVYYQQVHQDTEYDPVTHKPSHMRPRRTKGAIESTWTYGFASSNVEQHVPEASTTQLEGELTTIDPYRLLAVLWAAVQELDQQVQELRGQPPQAAQLPAA
jgi:hypothetical protein